MVEPKIKYDIEAAVKGTPDAQALATVMDDLSNVLEGELQQGAKDAAAALEALASKQRALDAFGRLKLEVQGLSTSLDSQVGTVDRLGLEMEGAAANVQTLAQAERNSRDSVEQSRIELKSKQDALKSLRAETVGAARQEDFYKQAVAGLKESIAQSRVELKERQGALRTASQETTRAGNAEAALQKEYQLAIGSAAKLSGELRTKNLVLAETRDSMRSMGLSTVDLVQQERNLQQAVGQVRREIVAMAPAYQQAAAASSQSTQVQAQNQRTLREGMTSISTQLARIQQIATVALGGNYAAGLAKSVAETADGVRNLEARIKLVTGEGKQFQDSWSGVTRVALDTNSALDETGTLFTRLAKASEEGGMAAVAAQQRALGLTQTINQAMQLSGASAESGKAALVQLIQGLQSGVLRGEEFNSVMEQAPRLAQALANGLGVTTGELRKLAEQGALTSETVMKALEGQSEKVAAEFSKLPPTVGRALQNLSTEWSLYVGQSDKGLISTANAAKVIDALAKNLDTVVSTLVAAGKAWAAIQIAGLVADFARWATNTLAATAAVEANTAATIRNTTAQQASGQVQAQNTAVQTANTTATAANTVARAANAAAWAEISVFARAATGAQAANTASMAANTAAVAANAAGAAKAGVVWRGASALFGPWGLAVAALTPELLNLGRGLGEQVAKWQGYGKMIEDSDRLLRQMAETQKEEAEAVARRNALYEQQRSRMFDLSKEATGLIANFDKLRKDGESAAEAINKIGKDFDLSTLPGIRNATAVLDKLAADAKLSAGEFNAAWAQVLDGKDLVQFEIMARAAFKQAGAEAELLQQKIADAIKKGASQEVVDELRQRLETAMSAARRETERAASMMDQTLREAVRRTGLEFAELQGRIGAASRSAINDLDTVIGGLDRLKAQGVDTGRVLNASLSKAINTADSQKAVDEVKTRIEQLRKVLGDKVTDGLLEQAAQKARDLKEALDAATPGVTSLQEAMRQLGVTSDEELNRVAKSSRDAFDSVTNSGTASAREVSLSFKRAAEDAIAASKNGVVPSWVTAQATLRGFKIEVDAAGKATLVSMKEAEKATNAVGDAARNAAGGYDQMAQSAEQAAAAAAKAAQQQADEDAKRAGYTNKDNMGHYSRSAGGLDWTGVWNDLKARGVDDETSRKIANEFFGPNGEDIYMNNPGQKKYGGSTRSDALGRAAAEYFRTGQDKIVKEEQERKAAEEAKKQQGQSSATTSTAVSGTRDGGVDRIVNIYVGASTRTYPIPTNSVGEMSLRDIATAVLQLIEQDGRTTGVL